MDNMYRLHRLAKAAAPKGSTGVAAFEALPGILKHGEDTQSLIKSFSLIPTHDNLLLRLIDKPYMPAVIRLLEDGGPAAIATKQSKTEDKVLFYPDSGNIALWELRKTLLTDGRRRNLHWQLAGGEDDILPLTKYSMGGDNDGEAGIGKGFRRPERYVISFKDELEARRFAREWHRRQFPSFHRRYQADQPSIVNAEILW
jgi:hypothetical protein